MYSYIKGLIAEKSPLQAVVDIHGIGYELDISLNTYNQLPDVGEIFKFLTYVHVREDVQKIFGFASLEEKKLFCLLITISGVGPKLALTILSGLELRSLHQAIVHEDLAALTSISGVGRKTAERIIIELREKVLIADHAAGDKKSVVGQDQQLFEDTLNVLVSLGYKKQQSQDVIKKVLSENKSEISVEDLVRLSLKVI